MGENTSKVKKIGVFTEAVVTALSLSVQVGTPIYIGENNESHIKERHPYEYEVYFPRIGEILESPDYVRHNKKHGSVDFIKVFQMGSDFVQVSVRVDSSKRYFAKTLFQMMSYKVSRYIQSGELVKIS